MDYKSSGLATCPTSPVEPWTRFELATNPYEGAALSSELPGLLSAQIYPCAENQFINMLTGINQRVILVADNISTADPKSGIPIKDRSHRSLIICS